ncbi:MAG: DUF2206 domain-containing protein [Halobacteriota archaeon]
MKLSNPLEMNDWGIHSFLLFSFFVLALLWAMFALNSSGVQVPLIQQVAGCTCLLFIPGIAILRILRVHKLGSVETPLFAIGLSILVVIFSGLLLNMLGPALGISDPFSAPHLILTMSAVTLALCITSYWRDKDFASPTQLSKDVLSPSVLSLILLPFLSVFGTYLVNNYEINWVILLMTVCIGVVVLVFASRTFSDTSIFPLAIFTISLALLLSNTLVSRYLWGWDVFTEARVANLVVSNAVWDPSYALSSSVGAIPRLNSVLSLSILAPALTQICNINVTTLFKIVYPIIFSLVPVVLYQLFRKQTSNIVAFLASFYFMCIATFFLEMPSLARQEIAELFLALVLLLIFNKTFRSSTKIFLLILFSGSMIVSHYGITWIFMLQLLAVLILLFLADSDFLRRVSRRLLGSTPSIEATASVRSSTSSTRKDSTITAAFVFLFVAMAYAWYAYTERSLLLADFIRSIINVTGSDLVSSFGTQAASKLQSAPTLLEAINDRLNTVGSLLIGLGVIAAFIQRKRLTFDKEYLAFAITSCGLAVLVFALPLLHIIWNASRLQHLYLIILPPFLVLGVMAVFGIPRFATKTHGRFNDLESKAYPVTAVFLVILLLFNTGFIFALAHQPVVLSPSMFHDEIPMFVHGQDLAGATWLGTANNKDSVYADSFSQGILLAYSNLSTERLQSLSQGHYGKTKAMIYVGSSQAKSTEYYVKNAALLGWPVIQSPEYTGRLSKIYDSGSAIYVN